MKNEPWRGDMTARCQHLEKKIARQKAEITRLEAARKWRPIETAPTGIKVLLWCSDQPFCPVQVGRFWTTGGWVTDRGCERVKPTHWLPYPGTPVDIPIDKGPGIPF